MNDTKQEDLTRLVARIERSGIASIRKIVSGIIQIINDPSSTAKDLKEIVEVDPPLSGKLLKVANSAYYSPLRPISGIEEAVIWLGFDTLKELTLSQKVCEIFNASGKREAYSREALWKHSVTVALMGKHIYRMEFGERGDTIYAAGILHDIGIIAADQLMTDAFNEVVIRAIRAEGPNQFMKAEEAVYGFHHAEIGEAVTREWKFPEAMVSAIGYHNRPISAPPQFQKMAATLYVSNFIFAEKAHVFCEEADPAIFQWCLGALRIEKMALDILSEEVKTAIARMEEEGIL